MDNKEFSKKTSIKLTLGHLLLAWEVLSDKFSDLRAYGNLSEEERRAIWVLTDLLEKALIENGIGEKPQAEWAELIKKAKAYIEATPADLL